MRFLFIIIFTLRLAALQAQQPIVPQQDANGKYFFAVGNVTFRVDPNHGARIDSYSLGGDEFLYVQKLSGIEDMYGSTAWLSPQNLWGWPPQLEIDKNAYTGGISGNKLILTSALATANNNLKFQMRKTFTADLQDSSVTVNYTIINKSTNSRSIAAWEIMRVPSGGLSVFPLNGAITGDLKTAFTIENGNAWWDYDSSKVYQNKAFADGKDGWLANINNKRLIHIKKFTNTDSNFPSNTEMEIEFYVDPSRRYTEIEKHTDYKLIPVNDSITLSMKWYLRALPENIDVTEGNPAILNYIDRIINPVSSGIPGQATLKNYSFYPNPASTSIRFKGLNADEKVDFQLCNILGETVFNSKVTSGDLIDIDFLSGGIYIYKLEIDSKIITGKLVVRNQN